MNLLPFPPRFTLPGHVSGAIRFFRLVKGEAKISLQGRRDERWVLPDSRGAPGEGLPFAGRFVVIVSRIFLLFLLSSLACGQTLCAVSRTDVRGHDTGDG